MPEIQLNAKVSLSRTSASARAMGVHISTEKFTDVQRLVEEWEVREEEMLKKEEEETVFINRRKSAEFISKLSIFEGTGETGSQRSKKTSDSNLFLTADLSCNNEESNYKRTVPVRICGGALLAKATANERQNSGDIPGTMNFRISGGIISGD